MYVFVEPYCGNIYVHILGYWKTQFLHHPFPILLMLSLNGDEKLPTHRERFY